MIELLVIFSLSVGSQGELDGGKHLIDMRPSASTHKQPYVHQTGRVYWYHHVPGGHRQRGEPTTSRINWPINTTEIKMIQSSHSALSPQTVLSRVPVHSQL